MATRTTVTLVDDIDGGTAEETVGFGLDGAVYEIDLSAANAGELRAALGRYVAAARRTGGRRSSGGAAAPAAAPTPSSSPSSSSSSRERNQEIRSWANEHGAGLSSRGRLPGWVVEAFEAGDASLLARASSSDSEPESSPVVEEAGEQAGEQAEEPRGRDGLTADERERIRAWAVEEGIEVKPRGQLKKDLIANYRATTSRQG
ncbi:Lsr2 family protein [Actinomycetospora sp. NBRC 106378]|uniref:histone-like nucleoid-structuring protein Lsr2 n=1 Tax=Actinomycetospora sp. NBRC 106378 TaxID=3032208 RepID=UPI0024A01444|nr:hypothetical protein Acsp07_59110 [Actinomycetospora sp. NBRC 106378]